MTVSGGSYPPRPGTDTDPASQAGGTAAVPIDRARYRRVRRYFARVLLHLLWYDVVLQRRPLTRLRPDPLPRWAALAAEFRELAVSLGGVLIKLGQFLSTRVDVLPAAVTQELSGLQDRVPPVAFPAVVDRLRAGLGERADVLLPSLDSDPVGAASLAQVHRARHPDGRPLVVKVLRPGIGVLVETDLAAVGWALARLRSWRRLGRRVDLDRLFAEFSATTRRELDLTSEAAHAERFALCFADDPGIGAPAVYHELSGPGVLALEDVTAIKIADHAGLDAAGIDRREVADRLFQAYMEQIFVHYFVHSDPHPGNLFVRPLPHPVSDATDADGVDDDPGAAADGVGGRPFVLVFVDFGMMTTVPPELRRTMTEVVLAIAERDAQRLVRAYREAGILLPAADMARIEALHEHLFDLLWGVRIADFQEAAMAEAPYLIREYRDLLYEAPFQFPVDLLFTLRAAGLVSGLTTSLDPSFDPTAQILPIAERLAREELGSTFTRRAGELARLFLRLPHELERTLTQVRRGPLSIEATLAPDTRRHLERIERGVHRIAWSIAAAGALVGAVQIEIARPESPLGPWLAGAAVAAFLWGVVRR